MLGRLIRLVVLVILGYYAYTVGWPWLQERLGELEGRPTAEDEAAAEAAACVAEADAANGRFASEVRAILQPPVDREVWTSIHIGLGGAITAAESACGCPEEACRRATEAMYELRGLLGLFDQLVRGASETMENPAVRQERVDRLLDEARALASAGS